MELKDAISQLDRKLRTLSQWHFMGITMGIALIIGLFAVFAPNLSLSIFGAGTPVLSEYDQGVADGKAQGHSSGKDFQRPKSRQEIGGLTEEFIMTHDAQFHGKPKEYLDGFRVGCTQEAADTLSKRGLLTK